MICRNCASVVADEARFCSNCGEKVDIMDYPVTNLVSSGPMKYQKTDLNIARLDLSNVRIDLNEEYSNYVIPPADMGYQHVEQSKTAISQTVVSDYDALKPKQNVQRNVNNNANVNDQRLKPMDSSFKPNRTDFNANAQRAYRANSNMPTTPYNNADNSYQRFPNMGAPQMQNRSVPKMQNENSGIDSANSIKSALVGFIMALVAMSFMGEPFVSIIISVAALVNASKAQKGSKMRNVAIGISLFVLITSLFAIMARLG